MNILVYRLGKCAITSVASVPQEKDAALSRRLQGVHWRRDGWRNTCKQVSGRSCVRAYVKATAARAPAHCIFAFRNRLVVRGMPMETAGSCTSKLSCCIIWWIRKLSHRRMDIHATEPRASSAFLTLSKHFIFIILRTVQ